MALLPKNIELAEAEHIASSWTKLHILQQQTLQGGSG
jgi:hypothetical protein